MTRRSDEADYFPRTAHDFKRHLIVVETEFMFFCFSYIDSFPKTARCWSVFEDEYQSLIVRSNESTRHTFHTFFYSRV